MYRSSRAAAARRRQMQIGLAAGVLAVAAVLAAVALTSGASGGSGPSGCAILDVSESTLEARDNYVREFADFATDIGNEGTGEVCVILAAADPLSEAIPVSTSVAPDPKNADKPAGSVEIEERVEEATAEVVELFEHPTIEQRGSGLVEAANVAARKLEPGDRLIYLSDGFQWTKRVGHLMQMDLSAAGITALLRRLDEEGLLPDLQGVRVDFPLLGFHPEGTNYDPAQENRLHDFWDAWATATRAELTV